MKREMHILDKRQMEIAKSSLKNSELGAALMGMTHEQAKMILKKLNMKRRSKGEQNPRSKEPFGK